LNDEVNSVDVDSHDVLALRGHTTPRLTQLVAVAAEPDAAERPDTPRSMLLYWRDRDATGTVEPVAGAGQVGVRRIVTGPPWLGAWVGPGWASPELVVRACAPTGLLLPADVGPASAAVAALDSTGQAIATLVATDGTRLDALGLIASYPDDVRALVAARTDERSVLVAWDPKIGTVVTITRINVDTQVSTADLAGVNCPWCGGPLAPS
jgi:hypothetical protein